MTLLNLIVSEIFIFCAHHMILAFVILSAVLFETLGRNTHGPGKAFWFNFSAVIVARTLIMLCARVTCIAPSAHVILTNTWFTLEVVLAGGTWFQILIEGQGICTLCNKKFRRIQSLPRLLGFLGPIPAFIMSHYLLTHIADLRLLLAPVISYPILVWRVLIASSCIQSQRSRLIAF